MTSSNGPDEKEVRIQEREDGFLVSLEDPVSPLEMQYSERPGAGLCAILSIPIAIPILIAVFASLFWATVLCTANALMCVLVLSLLRGRLSEFEPIYFFTIFYGVLTSLVSGIVLLARWLH